MVKNFANIKMEHQFWLNYFITSSGLLIRRKFVIFVTVEILFFYQGEKNENQN